MNIKEVYERLGIVADYEQEVTTFNERLLILLDAFCQQIDRTDYGNLIKAFAFQIGESGYYREGPRGRYFLPLTEFFKHGGSGVFRNNIKRLSLLLEAAKVTIGLSYSKKDYNFLIGSTKQLFDASPIGIGYEFTKGIIIVQGAKELDEKLILDTLTWLSAYPNARKTFESSLKHYLAKTYPDAIANAYSALESLVKTFLVRDRSLDNQQTRTEVIKKLELEGDWGQLLNNFSQIAHEFSSRHGKSEGKQGKELSPDLVEFYIYMTGTFIRLMSQRMKRKV